MVTHPPLNPFQVLVPTVVVAALAIWLAMDASTRPGASPRRWGLAGALTVPVFPLTVVLLRRGTEQTLAPPQHYELARSAAVGSAVGYGISLFWRQRASLEAQVVGWALAVAVGILVFLVYEYRWLQPAPQPAD